MTVFLNLATNSPEVFEVMGSNRAIDLLSQVNSHGILFSPASSSPSNNGTLSICNLLLFWLSAVWFPSLYTPPNSLIALPTISWSWSFIIDPLFFWLNWLFYDFSRFSFRNHHWFSLFRFGKSSTTLDIHTSCGSNKTNRTKNKTTSRHTTNLLWGSRL